MPIAAVRRVRAVWASVHGNDPPPATAIAVADVGKGILRHHAAALLEELAELPSGSRAFVHATQDVGIVITYPVRCMRLLELFGLAGLAEEDVESRRKIATMCMRFVREQPGASRPPSDNWAVAIVPAALLVWECDPEFAAKMAGADLRVALRSV
jgi:hypothetical protein